MAYPDDYRFGNRYRITGTLRNLTPLHVGDGWTGSFRERAGLLPASDDDPDPEYATVCTNAKGEPYLPGSTLKGVVRAWLTRQLGRGADLDRLFGTEDGGGRVEFHDAPWRATSLASNSFRWWDDGRKTCLWPHVSIDPKTRTAAEGLLYAVEFVPEGSEFGVTLTGQDWTARDLELVLFALEKGFSDQVVPATIGAEAANGWGRVQWTLELCGVIEPAELQKWLVEPARPWSDFFRPTPRPALPALPAKLDAGCVSLDVTLHFDGAFLVNDPSQRRERREDNGEDAITHATIRRRDGQVFLPSSSVRGALRSQARRIWQTLALGRAGDLDHLKPDQTQAKTRADRQRIGGFLRLFGAAGWRSPIRISDFELLGSEQPHRQEFVAIDRFTGGAAEQRKFKAHALMDPVFHGTISIEGGRLVAAGVGGWCWLLLMFLLRDLQEGDICFGAARSKGYGSVERAEITITGSGENMELLKGILARSDAVLADPVLLRYEEELRSVIAA